MVPKESMNMTSSRLVGPFRTLSLQMLEAIRVSK